MGKTKTEELLKALDALTEQVWEESASHCQTTGVERERYKSEARALLRRLERKHRQRTYKLAASIAGIVAICLTAAMIALRTNLPTTEQTSWKTLSTSYGERRQFTLPDNTRLTLNARSRISYPAAFAGNERRIKLEGEGYFEVARDEEKPFIIETARFDVKVLGTTFNVKAYTTDEQVSVGVESGKVEVAMPEAMMRLKPGEQMTMNTRSGCYAKTDRKEEVATWRKGTLSFHQTPLKDVMKELERIYHCTIRLEEGKSFNNLISGEHDNTHLEAVLQSICYATGIRYERRGNEILMYK